MNSYDKQLHSTLQAHYNKLQKLIVVMRYIALNMFQGETKMLTESQPSQVLQKKSVGRKPR